MKTKTVSIFSTAILLSISVLSIASAQDLYGAKVNVNANTKVGIKTQGNATSTAARMATSSNSTSTNDKNDNSTSTKVRNDNATSTEANDKGKLNAESHRSTVASFVQSLLNIANREGGIGAQVRVIANNQNDSATTTSTAMAKVDERSPVSTFFFGSDYKNLGVIRSELATTSNNIIHLKSLLEKMATSSPDRTELNAQIQKLETEQVKVNTYVTTHENIFSLFGWFTKLFVK